MENTLFLIEFFGWCLILNISVLLFSTIFLALFGGWAKSLHARIFNVSEHQLSAMYFQYLANYKIGILLLNLAPYFALKIMVSP